MNQKQLRDTFQISFFIPKSIQFSNIDNVTIIAMLLCIFCLNFSWGISSCQTQYFVYSKK